MVKLKVQRIDGSLGVILPQEITTRMKLVEDSQLIATDAPDGLRLVRESPDFDRKMEACEQIMDRYADDLKELAK
jgi:putative addiction module antidote